MSYKSILVTLDIDGFSSEVVKLAVDLAHRFDARLIGVSAADAPPPIATVEGVVTDGELLQLERQQIEKRLAELRAEFEKLAGAVVETEWRGAIYDPTRFVLKSACAADLIVSTVQSGSALRSVDVASLALGAGRPVLIATSGAEHLLARTVVVGWKDTREARRAVVDALPFLAASTETVVVTMDRDPDTYVHEGLHDVVSFLRRHGVTSRSVVLRDAESGELLLEFARSLHADLIVTGAYGHSRIREWAFGGVTRTLLNENGIHRLMSY